MKKFSIFLISLFAFSMFFSSCSNDEDSQVPVTFEGKWNFDKMSVTVNGVTSPELDYDGNEPGCAKDYIEFKPGGVLNDGDYSDSTCILNLTVGTWVKSGNIITITSEGIVIPLDVVSLTSTTFKIKYSETLEGDTVSVNMTFTKA
jgi:hypothetical protein